MRNASATYEISPPDPPWSRLDDPHQLNKLASSAFSLPERQGFLIVIEEESLLTLDELVGGVIANLEQASRSYAIEGSERSACAGSPAVILAYRATMEAGTFLYRACCTVGAGRAYQIIAWCGTQQGAEIDAWWESARQSFRFLPGDPWMVAQTRAQWQSADKLAGMDLATPQWTRVDPPSASHLALEALYKGGLVRAFAIAQAGHDTLASVERYIRQVVPAQCTPGTFRVVYEQPLPGQGAQAKLMEYTATVQGNRLRYVLLLIATGQALHQWYGCSIESIAPVVRPVLLEALASYWRYVCPAEAHCPTLPALPVPPYLPEGKRLPLAAPEPVQPPAVSAREEEVPNLTVRRPTPDSLEIFHYSSRTMLIISGLLSIAFGIGTVWSLVGGGGWFTVVPAMFLLIFAALGASTYYSAEGDCLEVDLKGRRFEDWRLWPSRKLGKTGVIDDKAAALVEVTLRPQEKERKDQRSYHVYLVTNGFGPESPLGAVHFSFGSASTLEEGLETMRALARVLKVDWYTYWRCYDTAPVTVEIPGGDLPCPCCFGRPRRDVAPTTVHLHYTIGRDTEVLDTRQFAGYTWTCSACRQVGYVNYADYIALEKQLRR